MNNQIDMMVSEEAAKNEQFKLKVKALIVSRDQLRVQNEQLQAQLERGREEMVQLKRTIEYLNAQVAELQAAAARTATLDVSGQSVTKLMDQNRQAMELLRQAMDKVAELKTQCAKLTGERYELERNIANRLHTEETMLEQLWLSHLQNKRNINTVSTDDTMSAEKVAQVRGESAEFQRELDEIKKSL